ncbi:MAG TPA: glycosyltransferase [Solirubrobacteraceae bacterium]|nr:glycosyltransferase [Solirubrobacteraceae bacterium]
MSGEGRLRVLCTCLPGIGHFLPMLPLARALTNAGHDVAFATAGEFLPYIEKHGFAVFPAGLSLPEQMQQAAQRFPEQHALPPGKERFCTFVPRMLAGVAAPARARDLVPVVREQRPDVIVHDETDFGAPVAAAVAGIPYADHSVAIFRPLEAARLARETILPLWEEWGVELGPFGGLFEYLYLDVCPPSLQSPEIHQIDVAQPMTNARLRAGTEPGPAWIDDLPSVPTVYVSLGTLFNQDPHVFAVILEGLGDGDLNVIVTIGANQDPAALGPQPAHVHVEGFIPQAALLPHCDVVINQGGTAIFEILAHGLPLLVLPQGANQFDNAEACVSAGVARSLLPGEISADGVRTAVRTLLDDSSYRERAEFVAYEIESMPGPERGARLVERLARERQPLTQGKARR